MKHPHILLAAGLGLTLSLALCAGAQQPSSSRHKSNDKKSSSRYIQPKGRRSAGSLQTNGTVSFNQPRNPGRTNGDVSFNQPRRTGSTNGTVSFNRDRTATLYHGATSFNTGRQTARRARNGTKIASGRSRTRHHSHASQQRRASARRHRTTKTHRTH